MGRKNRNKILEKKNVSKSSDEDEYDEDNNEQEYITQELHQLDIICKVRNQMIEYCNEMSLPLCDYLDHKTMENFIYYLVNM